MVSYFYTQCASYLEVGSLPQRPAAFGRILDFRESPLSIAGDSGPGASVSVCQRPALMGRILDFRDSPPGVLVAGDLPLMGRPAATDVLSSLSSCDHMLPDAV